MCASNDKIREQIEQLVTKRFSYDSKRLCARKYQWSELELFRVVLTISCWNETWG